MTKQCCSGSEAPEASSWVAGDRAAPLRQGGQGGSSGGQQELFVGIAVVPKPHLVMAVRAALATQVSHQMGSTGLAVRLSGSGQPPLTAWH